jgi:hypothetical protein
VRHQIFGNSLDRLKLLLDPEYRQQWWAGIGRYEQDLIKIERSFTIGRFNFVEEIEAPRLLASLV